MGRPPKDKEEPKLDTKEDRALYLKKYIQEKNREFGKTVINTGDKLSDLEKIPTGIKNIDDLLGGGFPCGVYSTVWGMNACGKSTLALHLVLNAQKLGKTVLYIALESFDKQRAVDFGIELDKLFFAEFQVAEDSLDVIREVTSKKLVDLIIVDSIHSLSPKNEQYDKKEERSIADDSMALLARKLSQFFRMTNGLVRQSNCCIVLIGQTRTDLGGFFPLQKLSGGNALLHYSRLILHMRKGKGADAPTIKIRNEDGKVEEQNTGFDCVIEINKTQISGTKQEGEEIHCNFYYKTGFKNLNEKE